MTTISILEAVNTTAVQFHGQPIITAMVAGVAYVAMRPIVENIGIDWAGQTVKLRNQKEKFNCCDISMVAADKKKRDFLCIPLRKLNGWLFSINPERVRADIKDKLIQYQEECFAVLHEYWTKGEVKPKAKSRHSTATQLTPLRQTAERLITTGLGRLYPDIWKLVHQRFDIEHIHQLQPEQIGEAIEYLNALEGEFLGKQEALPVPALNLPEISMQWWYENNFPMRRDNLPRHPGHQPWNDLTLSPAMMYGADTKSPALFLIETLEMMGFDLTGPRIEVETMRIMLRKGKGNVRVCGAGNVKHLLAL